MDLFFGLVALFFLSFFLLLKQFFKYFLFFILIILLYFTLFYFIFFFLSFFHFFSLLIWAVWMTGSWCSSQTSGLCLWGGRAKFRTLIHKNFPAPWNIQQRKSPRALHFNATTYLHSMTSKLYCWTPYAKQIARQEHKTTISREAPKIIIRPQTAPKHTTGCFPAHQKDKIQPHPPEQRH